MVAEKVTVFAGVPTMYWSLLGCATDPGTLDQVARNLRLAVSGGAALPGEVHRGFRERFGVTIVEGYGLTETSPLVSFGRPGEPPRVGSVGRPIWGVDVKLMPEAAPADGSAAASAPSRAGRGELAVRGEVAVRGHNVMSGYYGRPDETA